VWDHGRYRSAKPEDLLAQIERGLVVPPRGDGPRRQARRPRPSRGGESERRDGRPPHATRGRD
jgi:hypothetical protein